MIALYLPGTSPIHRMLAGVTLLGFALISLAITLSGTSVWTLAVAFIPVIAGYLVAGFGMRELLSQLLVVRWVIVTMLLTQVVFLPPLDAVVNSGRVLSVMMLAALVTLTTRIPALLDATERGLAPLRRVGVNPGRIGLMLAMTITTIPVVAAFASGIREAQVARGVPVRLGRSVVPLLVMSLKHSDDLADALTARGVE